LSWIIDPAAICNKAGLCRANRTDPPDGFCLPRSKTSVHNSLTHTGEIRAIEKKGFPRVWRHCLLSSDSLDDISGFTFQAHARGGWPPIKTGNYGTQLRTNANLLALTFSDYNIRG